MANTTVVFTNITGLGMNKGVLFKAIISMTPCFFFLYINMVMLVTLRSKATFRETPRYILFTNMLFADSLNLLLCMLLYFFALTRVYIGGFACLIAVLTGGVITRISPLNLAAMALERYIAISFPLRHTEIATYRRTGLVIAIVWALGSLHSLTDLIVFVTSGSSFIFMWGFCSRSMFQDLQILETINKAFTVIYFLSVGIVIIYTYICIVAAARSISTDKAPIAKAHKTVLLHLVQLGICLSSILFDTITKIVSAHLDVISALNIQYVVFVGLIIFPRCLSPLIYGLRDQMFRPLFKYYFTFGLRTTIKPIICNING